MFTELNSIEKELLVEPSGLATPLGTDTSGSASGGKPARPKGSDLAPLSGQPVLPELHAWARDSSGPPVFALLGEYGMGKTVTCQRFAEELRKAHETDRNVPLALYFDLKQLADLDKRVPTLDQIVEEIMSRTWPNNRGPYTQEKFWRWANSGAVVIFDGLDEVLVKLSNSNGRVFTNTLLRVARRPDAPSGPKVLISCRTQYFQTLSDQQNYFTDRNSSLANRSQTPRSQQGDVVGQDPEGSSNSARAMVLLPFTEPQIRAYLGAALPGMDPDNVLEMVRSVHNLTELTKRPYTLYLVSLYISELERDRMEGRPVSGVTLYRRTVDNWLDRDDGKHQIRRSDKLPLASHLAAHLWQNRKSSLPAHDIELWFQTWLDTEPGLRDRYKNFHPDQLEEDLRAATFLTRTDNADGSTFRFAHTSMQEFFLALYLHDAIKTNNPQRWAIPHPSTETLDFLGQLLAQTDSPAPLTTLGNWRHTYLPETSENLFTYALHAFQHGWPTPELRGIQLPKTDLNDLIIKHPTHTATKLDLSGANLTGAQLRRAAFDQIIFDDANLTNTILSQTYFHNCSMRRTRLDGAQAAGATWRQSQLDGATLKETDLQGSSFQHCTGLPNIKLDNHAIIPTPPTSEPTGLTLTWNNSSPITAIAYSPNGTHIATSNNDGTARIWNTTTGKCITTLSGHTGTVTAVAYSPDGTHIATSSRDGTARIWNTTTGKCITTLTSHTSPVTAVAYSPDGIHIATSSRDGTARIWNTTTGECITTLSHTSYVTAVAYSPDGTHIATSSRDGTARIWNTTTGKHITTLTGHTGTVTAVAYSPDGTHIATDSDDHTVRIWDSTGQNTLAIGLVAGDPLAIGGYAVWEPHTNRVLAWQGEAWRALRWRRPEGTQLPSFLPLESMPVPPPI